MFSYEPPATRNACLCIIDFAIKEKDLLLEVGKHFSVQDEKKTNIP